MTKRMAVSLAMIIALVALVSTMIGSVSDANAAPPPKPTKTPTPGPGSLTPLKLLNKTNDAGTVNGVPIGMTPEIVNYFKSRGIRVMLSIGGITYTDDWNSALATNPIQFGLNAAEVAQNLGVGIEIDYEQNTIPICRVCRHSLMPIVRSCPMMRPVTTMRRALPLTLRPVTAG